jgi:hypothetical protein
LKIEKEPKINPRRKATTAPFAALVSIRAESEPSTYTEVIEPISDTVDNEPINSAAAELGVAAQPAVFNWRPDCSAML